MLLQTQIFSEFSIIPQIGTAIGLIAFIIAIVFYYLRFQSANDLEKIKSSKEEDRANLIRDLSDKYSIPIEGISPDQKYALLKDKLELDYRKRNQTFKFLAFVTLLVAILIALIILFKNNGNPDSSTQSLLKVVFENVSNGDTIRVSNPEVKGKIIGIIPTNYTFYSVIKINNQYNLTTRIDVDKENKFDFTSNIGVTGALKIGIISCDEIITKNIDAQMSSGNYKLLSLASGVELIGTVEIYKK